MLSVLVATQSKERIAFWNVSGERLGVMYYRSEPSSKFPPEHRGGGAATGHARTPT